MRFLGWLVLAVGYPVAAVSGDAAPGMQEGLWLVHIHSVQKPGNAETDSIVKVCRDRAYDKLVGDLVQYKTGCTTAAASTAPNTEKVARRCNVGGSIVTTEVTSTVGSDTAHAEIHTNYSPAWGDVTDDLSIQDQQYLGKCPDNVKPGTVISAEKSTS